MELEERIGKRWSTWAGTAALLCAAGFYLQLASGRGWLGPGAKLAIAIGAGLAAIVVGDRALRWRARVLGQGLVGAGLGTVFGALHAGHALYGLYPVELAVTALIAITAAGMLLAVRHDAPAIAILAIAGGYLTPVLASRGGDAGDQRDALFGYLTVLDAGVLGVALARRWRGLEWVAFAGTWLLFAGWYHRTAAPVPATTLAWCAGFVAIFLAVPLAHHLRRDLALSRDRLAFALLDAAIGFGFACEILDGDGRALAVVALVAAAMMVGLTALVRRRLPGDGLAHAAFACAATTFATLAVPLALRDAGIALAWALEAPVLVWLGTRHRMAIVRHAGALVALLATGRLLVTHLPLHVTGFTPFLNPRVAGAASVALATIVAGVLARRAGRRLHDPRGARLGAWSIGLGALVAAALVHLELDASAAQAGAFRLGTLSTLAWQLVVTAGLLAVALRRLHRPALLAAIGAAALALALAAPVAALPPDGRVLLNLRFLALALTAATLLALRAVERRVPASIAPSARTLRGWVARGVPGLVLLGVLVAVSREAWQHARLGVDDPARAGWLGQAALSCAWSALAAITVALGFRLRAPALRLAGLGLFGLTAAKVLLVDLGRVEQIYRVTSFLVLGLLLFSASWLYHRPRRER